MSRAGPGYNATLQKAREEAEKRRPRLSQLDAQLFAFVTCHVEQEGELLAEYQTLAEESSEEYVRYLMKLIIADEQRHHQLLKEMANHLAGIFDSDLGPRIPWVTRSKAPTAVRRATSRLLRAERRDRWELLQFRLKLWPTRNVSLLSVLVDTMLVDTQKHVLLLRAIRRSTRE